MLKNWGAEQLTDQETQRRKNVLKNLLNATIIPTAIDSINSNSNVKALESQKREHEKQKVAVFTALNTELQSGVNVKTEPGTYTCLHNSYFKGFDKTVASSLETFLENYGKKPTFNEMLQAHKTKKLREITPRSTLGNGNSKQKNDYLANGPVYVQASAAQLLRGTPNMLTDGLYTCFHESILKFDEDSVKEYLTWKLGLAFVSFSLTTKKIIYANDKKLRDGCVALLKEANAFVSEEAVSITVRGKNVEVIIDVPVTARQRAHQKFRTYFESKKADAVWKVGVEAVTLQAPPPSMAFADLLESFRLSTGF